MYSSSNLRVDVGTWRRLQVGVACGVVFFFYIQCKAIFSSNFAFSFFFFINPVSLFIVISLNASDIALICLFVVVDFCFCLFFVFWVALFKKERN